MTKSVFERATHYKSRMGRVGVRDRLNHLKGLNHHGSQKDHLVRVSSTKKETFFNITSPLPKSNFPEIATMHQSKYVHPLVLPFSERGSRKLPTCRKTAIFFKNWKNLTNDPKILDWISGLKIGTFQKRKFRRNHFKRELPTTLKCQCKSSN